MELNKLPKNAGATHRGKRVGRGPGSGLGKTSGRGENGQKSRSGASIPAVFEGGQTPLFRRLHKRGFSNAKFKVRYATINVGDLNRFKDGEVITPELLKELGIVKKQLSGIKVLGNGTLEKKVTIKAHRFTQSALKKIEESGSKAEVI
jgi:large subunit ribosomal protein L15